MAGVDFNVVRREIREAAKRAFSLTRSDQPTETFYGFALYSDGDGTTICPSATSEDGYQRCLKRYEPSRKKTEEILAKSGITYDDYTNYYRWGTSEWEYCHKHADEFDRVYDLLNIENQYDEDDPNGFVNFKARVYGTMVLGLKDLDADGFFGTGDARESVTILCDITDSLDGVWLGFESARLLNPPRVFSVFSQQWLAWQDRENKEIISAPTQRSVYAPFKKYLQCEGLS